MLHRLTRTRDLAISLCCIALASATFAATDQHFDYTSMDNPNSPGISPHFGIAQFNVLNYPSINGNYMMTSTDASRPSMVANNNVLAEFYNNFLADYNTQIKSTKGLDAAGEADAIDAYTHSKSTKTGARPNWLILNELSATLWPQNAGAPSLSIYRQWVVDAVTRLHDTYGYTVVTYAPFGTVGTGSPNNSASWQALAAKSYIGVENYLSGQEVMNGGTDYASRLAWAKAQYQASKNTYTANGVPFSELFLGEHFGNTASGVAYGRAGISASDWDTVIQIRQDAIRAVGFPGFLAYSWGSNVMGITEAEQIEHEYWYRTRLVVPGQQPQWLSDDSINVNGTTILLSWNEQLNWIGGVPNAPGAVANFFRTNTAARSITLDGSKTIGSLSLNSSFGYTITPGSGGSITLDNAGAGAGVVVPVGTHAINVPVALADDATFDVTSSLLLGAGLTNNSGHTITKIGSGTLTITGTQSHAAGATFNANEGVTNLNSNANGNLALNANSTVNFGSSQNLSALTTAANKTVTIAPGGSNALRVGSVNISGQLDVNDNPVIVDYSASSPIATIQSLIKTGYNNGAWNGPGIMSTLAQTPFTKAAIGYAEASSLFSTFPATYAGQSIDSTTIVMRYTVMGDADFSGKTDLLDFNVLAANFGKSNMTWRQGDFNYDGAINLSDFNLLAASFGQSAPTTAAPFAQFLSAARDGTASIPLPAPVYLGVIGLACAFGASWKFRRH